jgi:hypothetical protein
MPDQLPPGREEAEPDQAREDLLAHLERCFQVPAVGARAAGSWAAGGRRRGPARRRLVSYRPVRFHLRHPGAEVDDVVGAADGAPSLATDMKAAFNLLAPGPNSCMDVGVVSSLRRLPLA